MTNIEEVQACLQIVDTLNHVMGEATEETGCTLYPFSFRSAGISEVNAILYYDQAVWNSNNDPVDSVNELKLKVAEEVAKIMVMMAKIGTINVNQALDLDPTPIPNAET